MANVMTINGIPIMTYGLTGMLIGILTYSTFAPEQAANGTNDEILSTPFAIPTVASPIPALLAPPTSNIFSTDDEPKSVTDAAQSLTASVTNTAQSVTASVNDAAQSVNDAAQSVTASVNDAAQSVTASVNDVAQSVTASVNDAPENEKKKKRKMKRKRKMKKRKKNSACEEVKKRRDTEHANTSAKLCRL
uniref:Uncharacterized protein n=1 Tax=viral metagenome TaxID=1070528 RepID=A0A6C0F1F2_9ZZZZ